jgi:CHAD domain-containing protein
MKYMKPYFSKTGKKVYAYINELNETFSFHLSRLTGRINEEDIHYLRRATKRLKAIYKLLGSIDTKFDAKKRFNPINAISEPAGQLREMQVNQKLLTGYNPSEELLANYSEYFIEEKKAHELGLRKAIVKFKPKKHAKSLKKVDKLCRKLTRDTLTRHIDEFFESQIKKIMVFLSKGNTEDNLHSIRILMKNISPSVALLDLTKNKKQFKDAAQKLKTIEDTLGLWHDRFVLLQSLHKISSSEKLIPMVLTELRSLIEQIEKEKSQLFSEVCEHLKNIKEIQLLVIS